MTEMNSGFQPRIINPVRIGEAVLFTADEQIRRTDSAVRSHMPWVYPRIVSDPSEMREFRGEGATVLICDDTALPFIDVPGLKAANRDLIVVLLSSIDYVQCSPPAAARRRYPHTAAADLIFAVNRRDCPPKRIVPAAIRCAEDRLNIERYSTARRFIFLVVEDEPRWLSQFLPILYRIIGQRADVWISRTYEEAVDFVFGVSRESDIEESVFRESGRGDDVVCLITDISFPKGNRARTPAGRDLVRLMERYYPRIPIIIASKLGTAGDLSETSFLLPKGEPGSLETLRFYIQDHTGLGDLIIHDRDGTEMFRIRSLEEFLPVLEAAEGADKKSRRLRSVLDDYGRRDAYSTWLYMHGFRDLADRLLPRKSRGRNLIAVLKNSIHIEMDRVEETPLVIDGREVRDLQSLLDILRSVEAGKIQENSDRDGFSTWLDRKGYPELAAELRPVHGSGVRLERKLAEIIEKWIRIYEDREGEGSED